MKRIFIVFLCVLMCVSVFSCDKSEKNDNAKAFDNISAESVFPLSKPKEITEPLIRSDYHEGSSTNPPDDGFNMFYSLTPTGTLSLYGNLDSWYDWGAKKIMDSGGVTISVRDTLYFDSCNSHLVILKKDGSVWCFGRNIEGEIGNGSAGCLRHIEGKSNENNFVMQPYHVMDKCVWVGAFRFTSAALTENGDFYVWGDNDHGQLGNGKSGNEATLECDEYSAVPYLALSGVTEVIDYYNYHFVVKTADGSIYAWGKGYSNVPLKLEKYENG